MARASYNRAIEWMVSNDDTHWVKNDYPSVTATLVADMFGKTDEQVRHDLRKALRKSDDSLPDAIPAPHGGFVINR